MAEEEYNNTYQTNAAQLENPTLVSLRLDMERTINKVEDFLSAKRVKYKIVDNEVIEEVERIGQPLANEQGINQILNIIFMRINTHVVQGNFTENHYYDFIERARKEIAEQVVINAHDWEIKDNHLNLVIDTITSFIEPFMSRLINNEERKSYIQQFQSREVYSTGKKEPNLTIGGGRM